MLDWRRAVRVAWTWGWVWEVWRDCFGGFVEEFWRSWSWMDFGGGGREEVRQFQPIPRKLQKRSRTQSRRSMKGVRG